MNKEKLAYRAIINYMVGNKTEMDRLCKRINGLNDAWVDCIIVRNGKRHKGKINTDTRQIQIKDKTISIKEMAM